MDAVEFPGVNLRVAEEQEEYMTLPAQAGLLPLVMPDGTEAECIAMTTCWKLNEAELEQVRRDGVIFITFLTFGDPMQPIHGTTLRPNMKPIPADQMPQEMPPEEEKSVIIFPGHN